MFFSYFFSCVPCVPLKFNFTHSGDYPKKWVLSTGIGGTFQTESGGTFKRNQWVLSTGLGWDFAPEYAKLKDSSKIFWWWVNWIGFWGFILLLFGVPFF